MAGRKSFYAIAALLVIAAMLNAIAPLSAWFHRGQPSFGLYDIRDPERLPPYKLKPEPPSGNEIETTTVYGPYGIAHYQRPMAIDTSTAPRAPIAIVEANATDTATLPDGQRLKIAALRFIPQRRKNSPQTLPVEQAYCDPAGKWMTKEAGTAMNRMLRQGEDTVWWSGNGTDGMPWSVGIALLSNLLEEDLAMVDLYDSKTGGSIFSGQSWSSNEPEKPVDGFARATMFSMSHDGIRPTPPAVKFKVFQGPETVLKLTPTAPQNFTWRGHDYTLRNITVLKAGVETIFVGEPKSNSTSSTFTTPANTFKLVFDSLPDAMTSVRAFGKDGKQLSPYGSSGSERLFNGNAEDIDHIEVRLRPDFAYVIFRLPELPIVPEANRHTTDLMEMVLPPVIVTQEWDYRNLIGAIVEAGGVNASMPANSVLTLPMDLGGKTVREVLTIEHDRYPPHEMAFTLLGSHVDLTRRMPGTTEAIYAPRTAAFHRRLRDLAKLLLVAAIFLAVVKVFSMAAATALRRALRHRGYHELSFWDAEYLGLKLGRKAWRLPHHDDLATIPGVDMADLKTVVAFMRGSAK